MTTLIFGGSGYIGSSLIGDIRISRKEVDLLDLHSVKECLRKYRPTHVISAAALHGSFQAMSTNHAEYLRTNLLIDSNILEAAKVENIEKVSILSSISGLPESHIASNESDISTGPVSNLNFGYNFSKYASTQIIKSYQMDGFENFRSFLLGNIYGYNDKFEKNTNVVATLIKLMHRAKMSNTDLELYGNGMDARCFTHLNDVAKIIQRLSIIQQSDLEPMIISTSKTHTILEISSAIAESMQFRNKIIFMGKREDGFTEKKVDNTKLQQILGQYDFVGLAEGISMTVNQYLQAIDQNQKKSPI